MVDDMNYYRIDYYSRRIGAYTYKVVKADTPEQAIKRSRIKNIEELTLVSMEKQADETIDILAKQKVRID